MSLLDLLSEKRVIMAAGPGGVGKTTTSATLGLALAQAWETCLCGDCRPC